MDVITTTATRFAECPMHSAKVPMHSANPLPSATLGKEAPSNLFTVKPALPSAKSRALGKGFAECQASTRQRIDGRWPMAHAVLNFFLISLPSATLGKEFSFFFQNSLPSAIAPRHSAKPVFNFF